MTRSITFTINDEIGTRVKISEFDEKSLRVDLEQVTPNVIGDLRGFFLDLLSLSNSNNLIPEDHPGSDGNITKYIYDPKAVKEVSRDVNIKGEVLNTAGFFDIGVEFGTPGTAKDDIQLTSFLLQSTKNKINLDSVDLVDLALRYTSVGSADQRDKSLKIAGKSIGVARNDEWEVDENQKSSRDLLENDTNGIQSDGTRKTVSRVLDENGDLAENNLGFERVVNIDGLELGTLYVSTDGIASFEANGRDIDKLSHDDIKSWRFTYETISAEGSLATADSVLTIYGKNDQPIAYDLQESINEDSGNSVTQSDKFHALNSSGVTKRFHANDIDIGDSLSFLITSQPVDSFGNQYGQVVNNNDGTFTFNPGDNFQFLDEGESRDVTFQYIAVDDSGVGKSPVSPEESDTSDPAKVTITVEGAKDNPIHFDNDLLFKTENQSMFGSGDAVVLKPSLPFFGFDKEYTIDQSLIPKYNFEGEVLSGIFNALEDAGQFFVDGACGLGSLIGLECGDTEIDLPDSITTPGLTAVGNFDAKVGLQPYFYLTSGDVGSEIPVDVYFETPRQIENGEVFKINSFYSVDQGATFETMSPNAKFGMDFVFDLAAELGIDITDSTFGPKTSRSLFPKFDTATISSFKGELGEPGFNLFNFDAEKDLEYSIDLDEYGSLDLNFPVINTNGVPDPDDFSLLESEGSDEVAVLNLDLDAVAAEIIEKVSGTPITFGDEGSFGLQLEDLGLNLITLGYEWDIVDITLEAALSAIQEFELKIKELPLVATLEDGSEIKGFNMGDDILIETPRSSEFDPDLHGDKDGLIDFNVSVDMDAVFSNDTYLGLDLDLFAGLLRLQSTITSDFFDTETISLFDGLIPSVDSNDDGFFYGDTVELVSNKRLATLFSPDEFDLGGWNTAEVADMFFDVA